MFDDNISVLVPYKPANEYREKNWSWIKRRYEAIMPNAEICIGSDDNEPFSRSIAINNAAKKSTKDIFIIADADIAFNINQIKEALEALNRSPWVIPYSGIRYLDLEKTNELYKKSPSIILKDDDFKECPKVNDIKGYKLIGGISVVSRKNFEKVGGFDERFIGWCGEDDAFQKALDAVCGQYFRLDTTMWHLYHLQDTIYDADATKLLDKYYKDKKTILNNLGNEYR